MKTPLFLFSLVAWLCTATHAPGPKHDFHVGITVAEYNNATGQLEIYMKLFSDDLQAALEKSPSDAESTEKYFQPRFYFVVEGKKYIPGYIGEEQENGLTYVYFEVKHFPKHREVKVYNAVFFDMFEDQSNIVNLEINGQTRSVFLNKSQPAGHLSF